MSPLTTWIRGPGMPICSIGSRPISRRMETIAISAAGDADIEGLSDAGHGKRKCRKRIMFSADHLFAACRPKNSRRRRDGHRRMATLQKGNRRDTGARLGIKSSPLSLALGRPVRDQVFTTRDNRATTFQALELVNGAPSKKHCTEARFGMLGQLPPAPTNAFDSGTLRKGTANSISISKA